ncbi:MAG: hypothetical protein KAQ64_00945 [Candidatus Pacebacteria bacterium]|nr:hypothetical protein [Candidatus Paceibacterota bacterium]
MDLPNAEDIMTNYKKILVHLWLFFVVFELVQLWIDWHQIPEQGIRNFPLITIPAIIIFPLTFLIIGLVMGLGKPKDSMPPRNKVFKVGYIRMIMEGNEKKIIILLESEKNATTAYKLPITVFERTESFSELLNKNIRNVYGTIKETQP